MRKLCLASALLFPLSALRLKASIFTTLTPERYHQGSPTAPPLCNWKMQLKRIWL